VSGTDTLVITNLDVLQGFHPLKMAVAYELPDGRRTEHFPAFGPEQVKPVLEEFEGFDADITGVRQYSQLPASARRFIEAIQSRLHVPVRIISVGPAREQVIRR